MFSNIDFSGKNMSKEWIPLDGLDEFFPTHQKDGEIWEDQENAGMRP